MYFQFKSQVEDFVVDELLNFVPSGKGSFHYFSIEKKSINTMDIVDALCANDVLTRKSIGIAGLKDKKGITRQRFSLHDDAIAGLGGLESIRALFAKKCRIIKETRHSSPLGIGSNSGNSFCITLRAKKTLPTEKKILMEQALSDIDALGFPNCFGVQRFGKGLRNYKRAAAVFEDVSSLGSSDYQLRFMLQAYPSMHFNNYTLQRRRTKKRLLDGDICVDKYHAYGIHTSIYRNDHYYPFDYTRCKADQPDEAFVSANSLSTQPSNDSNWIPSGPMLGWNLLLPLEQTESYLHEIDFYKKIQFGSLGSAISQQYKIFGLRRPLWVYPKNFRYRQDEQGNYILEFSLPSGSYATVLLAILLENIDPKGTIENGLAIPHTL